MIDFEAVRNVLVQWARQATATLVDPARVYPGWQETIDTQKAPRVIVMIRDVSAVGIDEQTDEFDTTTGEFITKVRGQREVQLAVQTFAPKANGSQATALGIGSVLQTSLSLPGMRSALNAAGIGVLEVLPLRRLPQVVAQEWEDSSLLEVRLMLADNAQESVGYFDKLELEPAPRWWWPMADDTQSVIRSRGNEPAALRVTSYQGFPKVIDGLGGKKARQFSRVGFDDVNLTVPSVARTQIDMRHAEAFAQQEWTFGAWLRRDAPLTVSTLTRIWSIRGGAELLVRDPDHVALPGAIGMANVYWNGTTGQLFARNQYGIDDVSFSASVAGFSYLMAVGAWHHIVVRKQNNAPGNNEVTYVLFVDGVLNQSITPANGKNYNPNVVKRVSPPDDPELATMTIGGASGQGVYSGRTLYGIDGAMQDVRVYDKRLTDAQIARWFSAPQP